MSDSWVQTKGWHVRVDKNAYCIDEEGFVLGEPRGRIKVFELKDDEIHVYFENGSTCMINELD